MKFHMKFSYMSHKCVISRCGMYQSDWHKLKYKFYMINRKRTIDRRLAFQGLIKDLVSIISEYQKPTVVHHIEFCIENGTNNYNHVPELVENFEEVRRAHY